ncbi:MAG: HAD family hydrolase [Acidiphilium sp.]
MSARPRLLSFDVFRTLLDIEEDKDRPEAFALLARFLAYHGIIIAAETLHQRVTALTESALAANPSLTPDVDILEILAAALGSPVDANLLAQAALVLRAATTNLTPVPGALAAVQHLAASWKLAICSNTQRAYTMAELRAFGFLAQFGTIIFSSDVRACKPDPAIFQRLFAQTGCTPAAIIHIGDNFTDDIIAAKRLGCTTLWVDRHNEAAQPGFDRSAADVIITPDLTDLPRILAEHWA